MKDKLLISLVFLITMPIYAQYFELIKDSIQLKLKTDNIIQPFYGCAMVDVNNDNHLDLFSAGTLYMNQGNGKFVESNDSGIKNNMGKILVNGNSWSDFDNDGDIDLLYTHSTKDGNIFHRSTVIYENRGNGTFEKYKSILDSINSTSWSAQWVDFNNDSRMDFMLTFADKFLGVDNHFPNRLFKNIGNGKFKMLEIPKEFLQELKPYTVSNWIDYDCDGDLDLFIASGPADGSLMADPMYRNELKESGTFTLTKIDNTILSFSETLVDGQQYSFIDIDNDTDLDVCLTNWKGKNTDLYRNENGIYKSMSTPFTETNTEDLSNAWGDFDNNGDLDVIITSSSKGGSGLYINDGNGTFVEIEKDFIGKRLFSRTSGISIGDYNNDGKLDFFVVGNKQGLFKNIVDNSNSFIVLKLIGNSSNKSGIGVRIQSETIINGERIIQQREISAQNTWNGQNNLRVHFGLGEAKRIETITIHWPSGNINTFENLESNGFYEITENDKVIKTT